MKLVFDLQMTIMFTSSVPYEINQADGFLGITREAIKEMYMMDVVFSVQEHTHTVGRAE